MFSNNIHNIHSYMKVFFQNNRKVNALVQSLIIYHIRLSMYWRKKDRKIKTSLNNMLRKFFEGTCIVKWAFIITENYFS